MKIVFVISCQTIHNSLIPNAGDFKQFPILTKGEAANHCISLAEIFPSVALNVCDKMMTLFQSKWNIVLLQFCPISEIVPRESIDY